jgi:hypothetical protein
VLAHRLRDGRLNLICICRLLHGHGFAPPLIARDAPTSGVWDIAIISPTPRSLKVVGRYLDA